MISSQNQWHNLSTCCWGERPYTFLPVQCDFTGTTSYTNVGKVLKTNKTRSLFLFIFSFRCLSEAGTICPKWGFTLCWEFDPLCPFLIQQTVTRQHDAISAVSLLSLRFRSTASSLLFDAKSFLFSVNLRETIFSTPLYSRHCYRKYFSVSISPVTLVAQMLGLNYALCSPVATSSNGHRSSWDFISGLYISL